VMPIACACAFIAVSSACHVSVSNKAIGGSHTGAVVRRRTLCPSSELAGAAYVAGAGCPPQAAQKIKSLAAGWGSGKKVSKPRVYAYAQDWVQDSTPQAQVYAYANQV
ncbi:hypothetical protein THAOC_00047, partial [Thalassiosira oceanica]